MIGFELTGTGVGSQETCLVNRKEKIQKQRMQNQKHDYLNQLRIQYNAPHVPPGKQGRLTLPEPDALYEPHEIH